MGLWSLLSAATTLGVISNFGFSNGLIKFGAQFIAEKKTKRIQLFVGTANAANIFLSLPLLLLFYFLSNVFAKSILTNSQFIEFEGVLPFCLLSLYINNIASSFISILDGCKEFKIRCQIQVVGYIFYTIFCLFFIKHFGLFAIALALCIQNFFLLIMAFWFTYLKKITTSLFPFNFKISIFKKLTAYGLKFQLINLLVFLFDPIVKFFITQNLGLATTGIYELTNKIIIQIRSIVVNLLQVMIPNVAGIKNKEDLNLYVSSSIKTNSFLSINAAIATLFVLPITSIFFIGIVSTSYIQCSIIMLFAWLTTMLTAPFYFACLGLEKLWILIVQHFLYCLISILLFYLFSNKLSISNVYLIPASSLVLGSLFLSIQFKRHINISLFLITKRYFLYFVVFLLSIITVVYIYPFHEYLALGTLIFITIVWLILLSRSTELKSFYSTFFKPI